MKNETKLPWISDITVCLCVCSKLTLMCVSEKRCNAASGNHRAAPTPDHCSGSVPGQKIQSEIRWFLFEKQGCIVTG